MEENNTQLSEEQSKDELVSIEVPEQKRKVYTDQGDPEITSLHQKWKRGKLNIQPDFQRGFVWDIVKASRLIESILLDIPLPVIYLSQEKDGVEYVIDGQQRLTSFFSFIDGKLPDPQLPFGKDFKLTSLNVFDKLIGKYFTDLPEELQDKILYYKIRTITFRKESEQDLKFEVFERLNTGAVSLNEQELRNCIYRGKYNDLLWELSEDKTFRELLGIKKPEKRMRDVELILRFASFYHATYLNYKPPIKKFLNNDMEKYKKISNKDALELRNAFKNTATLVKYLLGEHAFKRFYIGNQNHPDGYWEKKKFNASLYDILMDSFARRDKNLTMRNLDSIREAFIDLMTSDQQFIDSIELSTSSMQAIHMRFTKWQNALDSIFGSSKKEPRCFSSKIKDELFNTNQTCAICNQRIMNVDDAAVDHIEQYWLGGETIPDNARLTHRYCNNTRSRHDVVPVRIPVIQHMRRDRRRVDRRIELMGERFYCKDSISVLKTVSEWLIRKGKISRGNCPIKFHQSGFRYLIHTEPIHENNTQFKRVIKLVGNFYLDGKRSSEDIIKNTIELLAYCGIHPNEYDLDE